MVFCLKLDFQGVFEVRIVIFMYLQSRYVTKDSLCDETFVEVEGAHLRAWLTHFLKNFEAENYETLAEEVHSSCEVV